MYLAQLNVGRLVAPFDSPDISEFRDNVDKVNRLGQRSSGFIWLLGESNTPDAGLVRSEQSAAISENIGATNYSFCDDPLVIANLTVWDSPKSLFNFAFKTAHKQFFVNRLKWFERSEGATFVMWWIPEHHRPNLVEARERLGQLQSQGASSEAFDWAYCKKQGWLVED